MDKGTHTMKRIAVLLALAALLAGGCSQTLYQQGVSASEQGEYTRAVSLFYQEISANPQSVDAWRGLGIAFYELGNYDKAEDALHQANNIRPDARATLYEGMIMEKRGDADKALDAYSRALTLEPGGKTKNLIRAHLDYLISQNIHKEVKNALANEETINVDSIPANTIAVADFDASKLPPDIAPIARGLAEFTSIDLSKVKQLRVVDRLKLDVIQQELALSASGLVDPNTAPRVGKLLGSSHLVTATVLGMGDDQIRLDGVVVNTKDKTTDRTETTEGQLQKVFALQKSFVFKVIDDLGIKLTQAERDSIEAVPTESFLAFLAYSRGLEYQAQGNLGEAEAAFNQAQQADPGFGAAAAKAAVVSADMTIGSRGFESAVAGNGTVGQIAENLGTLLNGISVNIGGIPDITNQIANLPPFGGYGTVVVKGDLNGN